MVHWGLTRGGSAQSSWDEHLKSQCLSSDHQVLTRPWCAFVLSWHSENPAGDGH